MKRHCCSYASDAATDNADVEFRYWGEPLCSAGNLKKRPECCSDVSLIDGVARVICGVPLRKIAQREHMRFLISGSIAGLPQKVMATNLERDVP